MRFYSETSECRRSFYSPPGDFESTPTRHPGREPGPSPRGMACRAPKQAPPPIDVLGRRRRRPQTNGDHASPVTAVPVVYRGVTGARVRSIHQTDRSVNTYRVTAGRVRNARAEHRSVNSIVDCARVVCDRNVRFHGRPGNALWRDFFVLRLRRTDFTPVFFFHPGEPCPTPLRPSFVSPARN